MRHLLDSLSLVPAWHALAGPEPPRRVLDLGTGGGFPGVVLAAAWPQARVLLVDGTGKKVRAVAESLAVARIGNAEALQARGAELPKLRPELRRAFDLCAARAVGRADAILRELRDLVAPGGRALLMKGPEVPEDELEAGRREAVRRGFVVEPPLRSEVPGLERRTILVYRATRAGGG